MSEARRRCPQAVIILPRMAVYARESERFRDILGRYSPLVEPLSIDEAFIDAEGSEQLFGPAREIGERIRKETKAELQLTCSVGIAPVKFAAKIASDVCKPDGCVCTSPVSRSRRDSAPSTATKCDRFRSMI